jgi:glycosidase
MERTEMKLIIYQMLLRVFGNKRQDYVPNGWFTTNGSGKFSCVNEPVLWHLKSLSVSHVYFTGIIRSATKTDFTQYGIPLNSDAVVKGRAGSPFAITDYYDVSPALADKVPDRFKEFEMMLQRVHSVGIGAIIDFVPNHVSREYKTLYKGDDASVNAAADINAAAADENSLIAQFGEGDKKNVSFDPQNNFYYLPGQELKMGEYVENPARATGNDCFTATPSHNDWYETVKLNYGVDYMNAANSADNHNPTDEFNGHKCYFNPVPKTWKMMYNVLDFWCSKGVDGFRCDMAEMVPSSFWKWAIGRIKEKYPKVIFIAESYNPQQYSVLADCGFDLLYDKVGLYDKLKSISRGEAAAHEITACWQNLENIKVTGEYLNGDKVSIQNRMLNFLENHDEQRVASDFNLGGDNGGSKINEHGFRALPELVVSLMLNKSPFMLYFGQEFGERGMECEGYSGVDGKTSIFDYCNAPSVARFLNNELHASEQNLFAEYVKLLHIAISEKAISCGDTFDLEYANCGGKNVAAESNAFNPDRNFVFARRYAAQRASYTASCEATHSEENTSIIFIAVDFSQSAKSLNVVLPAHLFDFWSIAETDSIEATEMLSGKSMRLALRKDAAISMPLNRYGICILKLLL